MTRRLFHVDDGGDVEAMRPGYIHYRCEVYGGWSSPPEVEEGENFGWFTGDVDASGKYTFQPSPDLGYGPELYLFADEVVCFGQVSWVPR